MRSWQDGAGKDWPWASPAVGEEGGWGALSGVGDGGNLAGSDLTGYLRPLGAVGLLAFTRQHLSVGRLQLTPSLLSSSVSRRPPVIEAPKRGWITSALKKGKHLTTALTLTGVLGL